ncbi:uncharacterized protein METZ01_LOCUS329541, partial [marine metagenome]
GLKLAILVSFSKRTAPVWWAKCGGLVASHGP